MLKRNSYFLTIKTSLGSKDGKECDRSEDNVERWQAWLPTNETELCAPTRADLQILPLSISHRKSCWDCKHSCLPFLSLIPTYHYLIRFYVFCKKNVYLWAREPVKGTLSRLWFIDHEMRVCGFYVRQKKKKKKHCKTSQVLAAMCGRKGSVRYRDRSLPLLPSLIHPLHEAEDKH